MNNDELNETLNETLLDGIEANLLIALLIEGQMRFYHIEHTDDAMLKNALSTEDVRRLLISGEAE